MKLPSFRRLFKGDFKEEYQELVDNIGISFNSALDAVFIALNRNLTLADNLKCSIKDLTVRVDSNGTPTVPLSFKLDFQGRIIGLSVINVINTDNPNAYPATGVTISFQQSNTTILVNNITGLRPNANYTLKVVAWNE